MALLAMNNVAGLSSRDILIKSAEEHGIKVVVDETYNLPLNDATPLVSKAKARGAEFLACTSFFDDAVMIMRAAKAINYTPKLLRAGFGSTIPAWVKELGEDGNNVIAEVYWNPKLPYPGNDKINETTKARFNLPAAPNYFGLGYCWIKTLELGVQGAGTLDNKKIRDYLRSTKFDLPYGKGIRFDQRGLPPPTIFCTQVTGGQVELLWPKEVATTNLAYPRPPWRK
jgi:branched-chain amino acid transport system substrate-binding protein